MIALLIIGIVFTSVALLLNFGIAVHESDEERAVFGANAVVNAVGIVIMSLALGAAV